MKSVSQPYRFNRSIFRQYDIRGIVGQTLDAEDAYLIARAFATKVAATQPDGFICVGYDGRLTSPELSDAVCKGIMDSGVNVVDVGLGPTPMLYFASYTLKAAGAIMITGSHNPPDHNGFKFVFSGAPFFGDDIQSLCDTAEAGDFTEGKGKIEQRDVREAYVNTLVAAYDGNRSLNVVWDAGNGATGEIMTALCDRFSGMHALLNARIDGTFPAHHPDPTVPENLKQLIATVLKNEFDAGIAFDGDGDRMGGQPLMWKTGHSFIKAKMIETGAPLAGEMSGHMFFADKYYGYDDGLYAAVRLLGLLSRSGEKLSDLRKALPQRVNTPELRFPCDEERKFVVIEEIKSRLLKDSADFIEIDGLRVNTPQGWWLIRASNTQPMLVARCEALDKAGLEVLKSDMRVQLVLSGIYPPQQ